MYGGVICGVIYMPFRWSGCFFVRVRIKEVKMHFKHTEYILPNYRPPKRYDAMKFRSHSWGRLHCLHLHSQQAPWENVTSHRQAGNIESRTEIGVWIFSIWVWLPGWAGMAWQFSSHRGFNGHSPYSTDELFIRGDNIKSADLDNA